MTSLFHVILNLVLEYVYGFDFHLILTVSFHYALCHYLHMTNLFKEKKEFVFIIVHLTYF